MLSIQDAIKRVQDENGSSLDNSGGLSLSDAIAAVQSGDVRNSVNAQAENSLWDIPIGLSFGMGQNFSSNIFNIPGLVLGGAGRVWEKISPFSGRSQSDINALLDTGLTLPEINDKLPYEYSWLTQLGKGFLDVGHAAKETVGDFEREIVGDNPSKLYNIARGSGTSLGFAALGSLASLGASAPLIGGLIGASVQGGLEALTEASDFLSEANAKGKYDEALGTAYKDLLANLGLNVGLDASIGRFNPLVMGISNPFLRWGAGTIAEIANEIIQEPAQQVIEQAANNELENGNGFLANLGQSVRDFPDLFSQLAPEVAASTLLTQTILGGGGLAIPSIRRAGVANSIQNRLNVHQGNLDPQNVTVHQADINPQNVGVQSVGLDNPLLAAPLYNLNNTNNNPQNIQSNSVQNLTPFPIEQNNLDNSNVNSTQPTEFNTTPTNNNNFTTQHNLQDLLPTQDNLPPSKTWQNKGKSSKVRTMRGTEVDTQYHIVDVNDLIASTNDNGSPNPQYPQELQPRQRNREYSHAQISSISQNIDPELLGENRLASDGAPIIGSDMVVESGNGRILALRRAYKNGLAENYRSWLLHNSKNFGLSQDDVNSIQYPVLVRERLSNIDRVKFTSEANESSISQMSASENASSDAKKITPEMLTLFDPDKNVRGNKKFIQAFSEKIVPQNEKANFFQSDGDISKDGLDRVTYALLAKAYDDVNILNRLSEKYDDDVKNISDALINAAPKIAFFENGGFKKSLSIKNDIVNAVHKLAQLRSENVSVQEYLSQIMLFDDLNEYSKRILLFFDRNKRGIKNNTVLLSSYADLAMNEGKEGQGSLPGLEDTVKSKMDLLKHAIKIADGKIEPQINTLGLHSKTTTSNNNDNDLQTQRKRIADSLVNAGRSQQEAELASQLTITGVKNIAAWSGVSPNTLLDNLNISHINELPIEQFINGKSIKVEEARAQTQFGRKNNDILTGRTADIRISDQANASSFLHENGHYFLDLMKEASMLNDLSTDFVKNWDSLKNWLGIQNLDFSDPNLKNNPQWRNAHEKFATAIEKYVFEGKTPNTELKTVFEKFKHWLKNIYDTIRNVQYRGADGSFHSYSLNDDIRTVLDNLFSNDNSSSSRINFNPSSTHQSENNNFLKPRSKQFWFGVPDSNTNSTPTQSVTTTQEDFSKNTSSTNNDNNHEGQQERVKNSEPTNNQDVAKPRNRQFWFGNSNSNPDLTPTQSVSPASEGISNNTTSNNNDNNYNSDTLNENYDNDEFTKEDIKSISDFIKARGEQFLRGDFKLKSSHSKNDNSNNNYEDALVNSERPKQEAEPTRELTPIQEIQQAKKLVDKLFEVQDNNDTYNQEVYHGSPLRRLIKRFKLDYVGSGNDADRDYMYHDEPWGMHFTEKPEWAEDYRTQADPNFVNPESPKSIFKFKDGYTIVDSEHNGRDGYRYIAKKTGIKPNRVRSLLSSVDGYNLAHKLSFDKALEQYINFYKDMINLLRRELLNPSVDNNLKSDNNQLIQKFSKDINDLSKINNILADFEDVDVFDLRPDGALYKADIADNDILLDWDSPLSQQPQNVLHAINVITDIFKKNGLNTSWFENANNGKDFYSGIAEVIDDYIEKNNGFGNLTNHSMVTSLILDRAGIPGMRYNDSDYGHNNKFVIWNEDAMSVSDVYDNIDDFYDVQSMYENDNYEDDQDEEPDNEYHNDDDNESYNQIIGRRGAEYLDRTDKGDRIKHLGIAIRMNNENLSPMKIRLATGWELAPDGKWRCEIQDGFLNMDNIIQKLKKSGLPVSMRLDQIYNNHDLFDAYPLIGDINVKLVYKIGDGSTLGQFSKSQNLITVDANISKNRSYYDVRSTLIHEIQHVVQDFEGFDHGSNPDEFEAEYNDYKLKRDKLEKKYSDLLDKSGYNSFFDKSLNDAMNKKKNIEQHFNDINNFIDNSPYSTQIRSYENFINRLGDNLEKKWGILNPTPNRIYKHSGGEIEARNAQSRKDFSPDQRRNTLLADSQDSNKWILRNKDGSFSTTNNSESYNQTAYDRLQEDISGKKNKSVFERLKDELNKYSHNSQNNRSNKLKNVFSLNHWKNLSSLLGKAINDKFFKRNVQHNPLNNSVEPNSNNERSGFRFFNDDTERRYNEGKKGFQHNNIGSRVKNSAVNLINSLKGDFPQLSNDDNSRYVKELLRMLPRKKSAAVHKATMSFVNNLKELSPLELDVFERKRLLDDLMWRKNELPNAELPFGFTNDSLQKEYNRFSDLLNKDSLANWTFQRVKKAIELEENTMAEINSQLIDLAKQLNINLDGVLRNPHYYRHSILEYANAINNGNRKISADNSNLQNFFDSELNKFLDRSYLKKYKGSNLDINTNYIQANGEVRSQMLMDIEVLKTLIDIKNHCDISPKIKQNLKGIFNSNKDTFSQNEFATLSDYVPDGYTVWNPAGSGLIFSANSVHENILNMAINDMAEKTGIPIDKLLHEAIDDDDFNQLLVIPTNIADALNSLAKKRNRGLLGSIGKTLTDWWKKSVLFTPTRNLKYNFRNFTGDLDAVIAGNPAGLKFFGRAVKELSDFYYRGKNATKDLQDYLDRSGGKLNIESMQGEFFSNDELKQLQKISDKISNSDEASWKTLPKGAWNLIKKFFEKETQFTEWREHLLRYATYLSYAEQMNLNNGSPNNWGASIKDEVLAIPDVRDKAFKLSNELLGAYDQISDTGKQLRDMLVPFYSWLEVNARRYYRLLRNGFSGDNASNFAKRLALGQATRLPFYAFSAAESIAKISLLTVLVQAFNRFVFPDDDDKLPPDVKFRPHITLGNANGRVYYFDRVGAIADVADWFALDSVFLDAKELANGQQSIGGYLKKIATAPISKALNSLNPLIKMPYELATGRTIYPDVANPRTIKDNGEYIASSFGLTYPYRVVTGKPRSDWEGFVHNFLYSTDADEAAYFYTIDKVRQFQERVLDKKFDGFVTTKRGQVLRNLKSALRYKDKAKVKQYLKEYYQLDGSKNGLKTSMKSMNPLFGLSEDDRKKFLKWISTDDKKFLARANKYFHSLADKYIL